MKQFIIAVALAAAITGCESGPSGPDSEGIKEVERMNEGVFSKRVAHFQGPDAMLFVVLDPVWSTPDFDNVPFRHPDDMRRISRTYNRLLRHGIDEVVVWKFRRGGLAAAIPFKDGAAVDGYGEPDHYEKLMIMRDTLKLINKRGIDHPSVRDALKKLLMAGRFESSYDVTMIDIMIRRIRPFTPNSATEPNAGRP